jgi:glycosyltransferase involved in cell wall biosynthesis
LVRHLEATVYKYPRVTIGVCVRNSEEIIRRAIESIIDQDFPHELLEVIFVDDGSLDGTLSIIRNYVREIDITTKIFYHQWMGLGPSRNVVVKNAIGKFIIWVDGDMQLSKHFVRKQVEFMERNPFVGIAKGKYGIYKANFVSSLENLEFVTTNLRNCRQNSSTPLGTGGSIYRVEAIKQVGGFDENITGSGEDADAECRVKSKGWLLDTTDAVFYEIRRETWQSLWNEYFWHGKGGSHMLKHKRWIDNKTYNFFPPIALLKALLRVPKAYRLSGQKLAFMMPLHYIFKRAAWLFGCVGGLISSQTNVNHKQKTIKVQ